MYSSKLTLLFYNKIEFINNYISGNDTIKEINETPIKNIEFGIEFIIREMINDKSFTGWD